MRERSIADAARSAPTAPAEMHNGASFNNPSVLTTGIGVAVGIGGMVGTRVGGMAVGSGISVGSGVGRYD